MYKEIKPFLQFLKDWEQIINTDKGYQRIEFKKNDYSIVFDEDLREHKINFAILHPTKRILKVYFRECVYADKNLQIDNLVSQLKRLGDSTNEKEELRIYFDFLKLNGFLSDD